MASIGDICEILDSQRKPVTASYRKSGIYPYYGANGIQDFVDSYIFDGEFVLLAEDGGNFGSKEKPIAYRVSGKCWVNNHAHVLKPKGMLNVDYLCYAIMFYDVSDLISGTTRAKLNQSAVRNMQIPLPPLETQKKIADVLDKAKSLIDLRKKQIEQMDLLIKSKFIEMFGDPATNPKKWRVVTFAEVATIDTHMTTDWEKYNGLPHIGIENIEKDTGHITKLKLVRDSELISGKYIFDKRHIIYSKIRPNLNKVALPDFTGVCSADAYPILPKSNTTRYYLAFILRSQHFLDYILSHSDRTNIPKVNKKQLAGFELPLPPVEDQNSFTLFVDSVEEQKYMLQHGLHKMEINYKSLMQEYFG